MLKIIKVTGSSLSPFFLPGDFVLIWRAPRRFKNLLPGDFVVFEHDTYGVLIKEVVHNPQIGEYLELRGIHPASVSEEQIGKIPYSKVIGKAIRRIRQPG
jgi:signal peptidase I